MPALVVEVVGDTKKLTAGLAQAEAQLKGFSSRTSTIKSTGADAMLAQVRAMETEAGALKTQLAEVDAAAATTSGSFSKMGLAAGAVGLGVFALGQNFEHLGGQVGKFGKALNQLTTGDIVGFVQAMRDQSQAIKDFEAGLVASHNATKAMDRANLLAAAGFDELAAAARRAELQIMKTTDAFVDATKIHDPTSPGAIASDPTRGGAPKKPFVPKPLTPEQRRAFFDARIAREVDISRDIPTIKGQVAALRKIAAEIQNRIDATKDVTRRLNLEADQRSVNRQATSLLEQAARDQAAATAKAAAAQEAAAREAERAAAAARAEKFGWLDFALEKAEDTKTKKDDLKALREREKFVQSLIAHEGRTLDNVRELWRTRKAIRDLNKDAAADGDPLAGLMQVSTKSLTNILAAGTGLSAAGRRVLGANISGAEIQPMYVSVQIDGREVGRAVTKDQARTGARASKQTSGHRG